MARQMGTPLDILYGDDCLIAVNKPDGMFVHPTDLDRSVPDCMSLLRDQIGQRVYPVHRLDRGTSGVLLFALSLEMLRVLNAAFEARQVEKEYLTLVRGYVPDAGRISHAYCPPNAATPVDAVTDYARLATVELPFAVGRYNTVRYSLMRAMPLTGRQHQIRRHCAHLRHPVIGDHTYGDLKQNRFFAAQFGLARLMLLATRLRFPHPQSGQFMEVNAPVPDAIEQLFFQWGWDNALWRKKGKNNP